MIRILNNLPQQVVGIELSGEVTKDEYDRVYPEVEKLVKRQDEINYLVVVNTEIKNLTLGVWWDDFKLAMKHVTKWNKVAIVSDENFVRNATDMLGFEYPGDSRSFSLAQMNSAIAWVSENITSDTHQ
jgi:hypothetical protein